MMRSGDHGDAPIFNRLGAKVALQLLEPDIAEGSKHINRNDPKCQKRSQISIGVGRANPEARAEQENNTDKRLYCAH